MDLWIADFKSETHVIRLKKYHEIKIYQKSDKLIGKLLKILRMIILYQTFFTYKISHYVYKISLIAKYYKNILGLIVSAY